MAINERRIESDPETVFRVLAQGWLYPTWVVGASRMRRVDGAWPEEGARIHHSVGVWPFLIDDSTSSLEWDPPRRMVLRARGWPAGEARVVIEARPEGSGCVVRIEETATRGLVARVPRALTDPALRARNRETLRRVAFLVEGGAGDERA